LKTYQVKILSTAQKELASLPGAIQKRIGKKIDSLQETPRHPGTRMLKGQRNDFYRLRVGDYRILYEIKSETLLVVVIKIGHRRNVYRGF